MKLDTAMAQAVGVWSLIGVIVLAAVVALLFAWRTHRQRLADDAATAQSDAKRWYDMLSRQLTMLSPGQDELARRELSLAAQRHAEAATRLADARTATQFRRVRQVATEGLRHIGAARSRLGLTTGPQGPPPVAADGRPMYEEGYWVTPGLAEVPDRNVHYEPRGATASLATPHTGGLTRR